MGRRSSKTVLFLCTGNYYRSRFAEILFNSVAGRMALPWRASSRGLALERGINNVGPMARSAIKALEAMGISSAEDGARFPLHVTADDFASADFVVAVKRDEHLPLLQERFPDLVEKVEFWDIDDAPEVLSLIEREVMDLAARLINGRKRQPLPIQETSTPVVALAKDATRTAAVARLGRETKGRRGKGVTTIADLPLDQAELQQLAAELKQRCGTGGTVKDGRIEIQGDQRDRLAAELKRLGYRVQRVGG